MKIAFVVNEFPSLSETFVVNQITGLIDRGHDVDIFARKVRNDLKVHDDVKRYNLLRDTSYPLPVPPNKLRRVLKALRYVAKLGGKTPLPILRSLNMWRYGKDAASLNLLYQIIPYLEKGPYDIIHCQFGMFGPEALFLREVGAVNAKLVTSFRGYDASLILENTPDFYDDLFRKGDLFCPVSDHIRERIIEKGCDQNKIIVLRSGVDLEKFKYFPRSAFEGEVTKLLTIARLVEKKGVRYGIEAVARLVRMGRRVNYVVAGDGPLRADLERLIDELAVTRHVHLIGWQTHEEVFRLLCETHILVAPSVTAANGDQEGIPNAIKEAMALGLPVVSTLHGGITELIEDGVSGFLVPERNVGLLIDRLSYLIDRPEIWPRMGRAARARVEKDYDISKLNDQLVETYQNLLNGKN